MGAVRGVHDWRRWRPAVRARLAGARAELIWQLVGQEEATLSSKPIIGDWTAKDILAHVAAWDDLYRERIELVLAGRLAEIEPLDADLVNTSLHDERRASLLRECLEAALAARKSFLDMLARADDEALARTDVFPWGELSIPLWTEWRAEHDREHAAEIRQWRERTQAPESQGPTAILIAALRAARKELLTALALVPARDRPVFNLGNETLREALRRLSSDEAGLIHGRNGRLPDDAPDASWDEVWHDLHRIHELVLRRLRDPDIGPSLGREGMYRRFTAAGRRDRALAARVRESLARG